MSTETVTANAPIKLTCQAVEEIFFDCFLKPDTEISQDGTTALVPYIHVTAITQDFGFSPERVDKHAPKIKALLDCLDDKFKIDAGGGWTFLNACFTKEGEQWGEHQNMEQLMAIGIAAGYVGYLLPKAMWADAFRAVCLTSRSTLSATSPSRLPSRK